MLGDRSPSATCAFNTAYSCSKMMYARVVRIVAIHVHAVRLLMLPFMIVRINQVQSTADIGPFP